MERQFIKSKERDVIKSVRIPESLHKRLKFYALMQERTEGEILAEILRRELDSLNVQLPY